MSQKTPQICGRCAGAGAVDTYRPETGKIERTLCPDCNGQGTILR